MTIARALKAVTTYPIPSDTLFDICEHRELIHDDPLTNEIRASKNYKLAQADLYEFLSSANDVSQGGVTIAFSESERTNFKRLANAIRIENGEKAIGVKYGYKGSKF